VLKVKVKVKGHVIRALSWILGMSYSVIDGLVCRFQVQLQLVGVAQKMPKNNEECCLNKCRLLVFLAFDNEKTAFINFSFSEMPMADGSFG